MVQKELTDQFEKTLVHEYSHWKNGEKTIDFRLEKEALSGEVSSFSPYDVFAKSVGSILAIQSIAEGIISPDRFLSMGLPIELISKSNCQLQNGFRRL